MRIRKDYLDEDGRYKIQVRPEVLQQTLDKLDNFQQVANQISQELEDSAAIPFTNQMLFIELFAFCLERLKYQFEKFKRSPMFIELEDEINRQEKLYEILVDASIITK